MHKKDLLSLPINELHSAILTEELIIELYNNEDKPANAKVCMALMNLFFINDELVQRLGPIAIRQQDGFVLEGRTLLVAIHGFLLAKGRMSMRAQIIIIN